MENAAAADRAEALRRIGHSLRTPLNAITGAYRLLASSDLTPDQRSTLEVIADASESLLSAVNDLLDVSEIESGGLALQQIPFRLPDAIREAVRPVRALAADRGIEVTMHGLSALPTDVLGDPGRLRKVVTRLVDNAVRFTHEGRVQVGAGLISHDPKSVTVRLAVRDTGMGIPPEDLARIFEPFAQGSEHAQLAGAGLGLAISQSIVNAMGGRISVDSKPGRGSTFDFTVTFPRHISQEEGRRIDDLSNRWVIVVGDKSDSNQALTAILREAGLDPSDFTEVPLASASVALSDDPSLRPVAIVAVPSAFPFDLARRIKRDPHLSGIPLVLVPPHGERGDGEVSAREGIDAYLPHPISPVDLLEAVQVLAAPVEDMPLVTRHWLRERRNRLRVLVVDDSPTGRALVIRALEGLGHETAGASTGAEAVRILGEQDYDVVLMDMEMPEMDGIQATRYLRDRGSKIPIIGVSAHAFSADRQACLDAGMDEHVVKPFRIERLQMVMDSLVQAS